MKDKGKRIEALEESIVAHYTKIYSNARVIEETQNKAQLHYASVCDNAGYIGRLEAMARISDDRAKTAEKRMQSLRKSIDTLIWWLFCSAIVGGVAFIYLYFRVVGS